MRENRASSTAKMVALWRALAHEGYTTVPGFHDPYAAEMLTGYWQGMLRLTLLNLRAMRAEERALTIAQIDTVPIRVGVIDKALTDALQAGCEQFVLLGAGFDTRAYRIEALKGRTLFEVDHPATQAAKRARAEALPSPAVKRVWVPVDFLRDRLSERLESSGHNRDLRTVWVWEGVVMYLNDDAVMSSLREIRACSAPGSRLILHYHEGAEGSLIRRLMGHVTALMGEPQIGVRSRVVMRALVESAGFQVQEDWGIEEQVQRLGAALPHHGIGNVSRVMVAVVAETSS